MPRVVTGSAMRGIVVCVVVVASARQGDISLLERSAAVNVGGRSGDIALTDVNRDGHLDLIATRPPDPTVSVHLGDGKGHSRRLQAVLSRSLAAWQGWWSAI